MSEQNPEYYKTNPVIVLREEFDDWAMLYNPDTADTLTINPVGVAVWKLLDGKHSIGDIAGDIKSQCEDAPDTILEDMSVFINDLNQRGFLQGKS